MKKFTIMLISTLMFFSSNTVFASDKSIDSDFWAYKEVILGCEDGWLTQDISVNETALKTTAASAISNVFGKNFSAIDLFGSEDGSLKRGELANAISKFIYTGNIVYDEPLFTDISTNSFKSAIEKCFFAGIFKGYSDGTFKPDKEVTNAELSVIISKIKENNDNTLKLLDSVNEKFNSLSSFTMDFKSVTNMSISNAPINDVKVTAEGTFKEVINDISKLDVDMSGDMTVSTNIGDETVSLQVYYSDGKCYISSDDMDFKQEIDFNSFSSDFGFVDNINDISEDSLLITGYVKTLSDGMKDIYTIINTKEGMELLSSMNYFNDDSDIKFNMGDISVVYHIDSNNNILGYDIKFAMSIEQNGEDCEFDMNAQYKIRDFE